MGIRSDGIRTLDDLRARCVVDADTGCWTWKAVGRGDRVPMVSLAAGAVCDRRVSMAVRRAAWLMSGRKISPGCDVYLGDCINRGCVCPEHCRSGLRKSTSRAAAKRGSFNDPERKAMLYRYMRARIGWKPQEVDRVLPQSSVFTWRPE